MGEQHQGQSPQLGGQVELLQPVQLNRLAFGLGGAIEGEQRRGAAPAAASQWPPGQKNQQAGGPKHQQAAEQRLGLSREPKGCLYPETEFRERLVWPHRQPE